MAVLLTLIRRELAGHFLSMRGYVIMAGIQLILGGSLLIKQPPVLAWPIQLDFGYQYHLLQERDFSLTGTTPANQPYQEDVTASGDVHVFSGSFTLKF